MKAYTTLNADLSNLVSEILNYMEANKINYREVPPFKNLGNAETLSEDIPSLNTALDEFSLSFKDLFVYTVYPLETISSSPGQYIIIPLKNYNYTSFSINELNPDAELQESEFYNLGYYNVEDATELERVNYAADTIYLFNSNVYTSIRYGDDMPLYLCATVNEDLSSYFTE